MATTTPRFTKDEFMTAHELVKKLNNQYEESVIKKAMATEFKKGTKIINGSVKRELIIKPRNTHRADSYKLHPLGFEKFKEILEKGK